MPKSNLHKFRQLHERLPKSDSHRLVIITGARQTGKTTLARTVYPELRYVNLDAAKNRDFVRAVRSLSSAEEFGAAILDEAAPFKSCLT